MFQIPKEALRSRAGRVQAHQHPAHEPPFVCPLCFKCNGQFQFHQDLFPTKRHPFHGDATPRKRRRKPQAGSHTNPQRGLAVWEPEPPSTGSSGQQAQPWLQRGWAARADLPVPAVHPAHPVTEGHGQVPGPSRSCRPGWGHRLSQPPPLALSPAPSWSSRPGHRQVDRAATLGSTAPAPSPVSPWKVGRSRGSPCQHRCMRRSRWLQARGLALQTGGSSGRWPFTTFTMMCRMFFSSAGERHTSQGRAGPLSPEETQLWGSAEGHVWPGDH